MMIAARMNNQLSFGVADVFLFGGLDRRRLEVGEVLIARILLAVVIVRKALCLDDDACGSGSRSLNLA